MIEHIDLQPYFNTGVNPELLDIPGDFFDGTPLFSRGELSFRVSRHAPEAVSCDRQEIPIGRICKRVHFLGFSDFGLFRENVVLRYESGVRSATVEFHEKSWFTKLDQWSFKKQHQLSARNTEVFTKHRGQYIYHSAADAAPERLVSLTLPDNINLILFAISIEI